MNIYGNIFNKISANWIQKYIKRIIYYDQLGFVPVSQDGATFTNQSMWYTTLTKEKIKITFSIHAEKSCDKIQHPFMIKTLVKVGIEGTYLNIIKAIYDKPTATSYTTAKSWKHFLKDQEKDKDVHSHTSFQHSIGSPAYSSQFACDMILYIYIKS